MVLVALLSTQTDLLCEFPMSFLLTPSVLVLIMPSNNSLYFRQTNTLVVEWLIVESSLYVMFLSLEEVVFAKGAKIEYMTLPNSIIQPSELHDIVMASVKI